MVEVLGVIAIIAVLGALVITGIGLTRCHLLDTSLERQLDAAEKN